MTEQRANDDENGLSRRTFMKASGAIAGIGLLGNSAVDSATAGVGTLDDRLLNWRVAEARRVWERGYRGRPDRTLGLTDSGLAGRHPDLGPWNGLRIRPTDDGIELLRYEKRVGEIPVTEAETIETHAFDGTVAGTTVENFASDETDAFEFDAQDGDDITEHRIAAVLSWEPDAGTPDGQLMNVRATLQRAVDDDWEDVGTMGTTFVDDFPAENRIEEAFEVDADETYRFVVEPSRAIAQWELDVELQVVRETGETEEGSMFEVDEWGDETAILPEWDPDGGGDIDQSTPKTVAWYNEQDSWGSFDVPRDENGHGTHVAGIMSATGRASVVDTDRTEVHEPNTVLFPTDFLEYEVDVPAGTSVFASGLGQGVVIEIVHDDQVLHESPLRFDSIIADVPTVHDAGEETYTVRVKPAETQSSVPFAEQAQEGNPLAGRIETVAVGAYRHPAETVGEREASEEPVVHAGVAPNFSLAGFQGLAGPTNDLGDIAAEVAETLNLRAVNMSWGPLLGAPLSAFGLLEDTAPAIRNMADEGILTVAAAGNSWTPANGNGEPAAVGEAISVVATDPFDGITGYSSGGIGTVNEDLDGFDFKPDVTAPGGDIKPDALAGVALNIPGQLLPVDLPGGNLPTPDNVELVRATANPDPDAEFADPGEATASDTDVARDHRSIGGTSMASPYVCGVAGLVSQAMEEDAPESIAMPEPGETTFDDVMRLKQVLLATASTTALTAAPYHNAQLAPSPAIYAHGERDPYEGFGRVNPDAAVDAVTRDLLPDGPCIGEFTGDSDADSSDSSYSEFVGVNVPDDPRAVAGYVTVRGGTLEVDLEFSHYSGGNAGMAMEDPHLDLFVYDAESPDGVGEPNIVESDVGIGGSASVTVDIEAAEDTDESFNERTFMVVAKIVNIPGVVNGFDVQAHFDLDVSFEAVEIEDPVFDFVADGERDIDDSTSLGSQVKRIRVTLEEIENAEVVSVRDEYPDEWEYLDRFSDGEEVEDGVIDFGTLTDGDLSHTFTYFVESPDSIDSTNVYTFGPATAEVVESDIEDSLGNTEDEFGGTDEVLHAGTGIDTDAPDPDDLVDVDDVTDIDVTEVVGLGN